MPARRTALAAVDVDVWLHLPRGFAGRLAREGRRMSSRPTRIKKTPPTPPAYVEPAPRHNPEPEPAPAGSMTPLSPGQLACLDRLAAGLPATEGGRVPSAREIVAALRVKCDWALAKPSGGAVAGMTCVLVSDPYTKPE